MSDTKIGTFGIKQVLVDERLIHLYTSAKLNGRAGTEWLTTLARGPRGIGEIAGLTVFPEEIVVEVKPTAASYDAMHDIANQLIGRIAKSAEALSYSELCEYNTVFDLNAVNSSTR